MSFEAKRNFLKRSVIKISESWQREDIIFLFLIWEIMLQNHCPVKKR